MKRKTYQRGSVVLKSLAKNPDIWVFRYKEGEVYRSIQLGDIRAIPTKALAEKAADKHRLKIRSSSRSMNMAAAIDRYIAEDMSKRESTRRSCLSHLAPIRQQWGKDYAQHMADNLGDVEMWLNGLKKRDGAPLSKKTKAHIKAQLHTLFESIMRWGGLEVQRNPISLLRVKGRPGSTRVQVILTVEQFEEILPTLPPHVRTMAYIAMCLGLRASELLGLKWEDIDLVKRTLTVNRSAVGKHTDDTKTVASNDELPLHEKMVAVLRLWRRNSKPLNGWVFESPVTGRPYHRDSLQADYIKPAGKAQEINLGWHVFRHTYRHNMRELGLPLEVQQRLMRHADIRTTSQYGGKKMELRGHNASVVEMVTRRKQA